MEHFGELEVLLSEILALCSPGQRLEMCVEYSRFWDLPVLAVRWYPALAGSPIGTPLALGTLDHAVEAAGEHLKLRRRWAKERAVWQAEFAARWDIYGQKEI